MLVMPEFSMHSYEQVSIAIRFVQGSNTAKDSGNIGSCPNGLDKDSGQCKTLEKVPPTGVCKMFSESNHRSILNEAKFTHKMTPEEVAVHKLGIVPLDEIRKNF